jgi:hypothetical protein
MDFFELVMHILQPAFLPHSGWRHGPPPLSRENLSSARTPAEIGDYLNERLTELRRFLDGLDPGGADVGDIWRRLAGVPKLPFFQIGDALVLEKPRARLPPSIERAR